MIGNSFTKELYNNKVYENKGNSDVIEQVADEAKVILDVGCGAGDNARILKKSGKYVTGITISNDEASIAREICDEVIIANIEDDDPRLTKKYDAIILSHVCEHLIHPSVAISKLSRYLVENGVIIIAVPNTAYYKNRLKLLKGDWTMNESGPFDKTHLHFYSYRSADTLCNEENLRIVKKIPGQLAMPLWPLRKLLPGFCKKIDNSLGKYLPNLFSQQVILVLGIIK